MAKAGGAAIAFPSCSSLRAWGRNLTVLNSQVFCGHSSLRICEPASRGENLFVYDLDLLVEHFPGKPVDRNAHPIMLLAFNDSEHAHQVPRGKQRAMVLMDSCIAGQKNRSPEILP